MRHLILDFISRRGWALFCITLFAAIGAACGASYVFTPFALTALAWDGQHGLFRTACGLPLTRRARDATWWLISVPLATLAGALGLIIGAAIYQSAGNPQMIPLADAPVYTLVLDPNHFAPWFSVVTGVWFGLGYAALNFLIISAVPTRTPTTVLQNIRGVTSGLLIPIGSFAPIFAGFITPKNPGMWVAWHWMIAAAVPILLLLSWRTAPLLATRRISGFRGVEGNEPEKSNPSGGITGMKLLLVHLLTPPFYFSLFFILVYLIGGTGAANDERFTRFIAFFIFFLTVGFSAAHTSVHDLRVLRTLPISTARLIGLRMIAPLGCGLGCALVITVMSHSESNWADIAMEFAARLLTIGGGLAFASACRERFPTGRFLLTGGFGYLFASMGAMVNSQSAPLFIAIGSAAVIASYLVFKHTLRGTQAYQKQRHLNEAVIARNG